MEVTPSDVPWNGLADDGGGRPVIPGYRILGRLGQGGQGAVFLAEREADGRRVAIKVLHAGAREARRRFQREIALSRSFAHPNVVKILDGSLAHGQGDPWLAMEYLEGRTLDDVVGEGPLSEERVRQVARDMARGLEYLHGRGLVHRDLKPANVFLEAGGRAILLDFGLATGDELTRMTATSDIPGTFVAMAPEQLLCQPLSPATDVYQLGFTLYVALTGHPPFTVEELVRGISTMEWSEPPTPASSSGCSAGLSALVVSCLQADPARRPADGRAVVALLDPPVADDEPSPLEPPVRPSPLRAERGRLRPLVGLGLLLVCIALVLVSVRPWGRSGDEGASVAPAVSEQAELLAACYGGSEAPDPTAVTAVLRELDVMVDPAVDAGLRSSLAHGWRQAARTLAEDDPARSLVEAALHLREGARGKAQAALLRALEGQRERLKDRARSLTPAQLALEADLLGRWAGLAVDDEEPSRVHRLLDEGDRFHVSVSSALAAAPAASTLHLLSLAGRWRLWGRQGRAGEESRQDAASGLAALVLAMPDEERSALPPWCASACEEAVGLSDDRFLGCLPHPSALRALAREATVTAVEAAHVLNETNHDIVAVGGGRASWLMSVAVPAVRHMRRACWLTWGLAWRRGAGPEAAAPLAQVVAIVAECRLRGRLADVAVAGRWGEGFEPDVLVEGAIVSVLRILESVPGLAGEEMAARAVAEWWGRLSSVREVGPAHCSRLRAAVTGRPLLRRLLETLDVCQMADPRAAPACEALLAPARGVLAAEPESPDLSRVCAVVYEGLRPGWASAISAGALRETEAAAAFVARSLDRPARPPGAPEPVRLLWGLAVVVGANARVLGGVPVGAPDEASRWFRARLAEVAGSSWVPDRGLVLERVATDLLAGRVVWRVVEREP